MKTKGLPKSKNIEDTRSIQRVTSEYKGSREDRLGKGDREYGKADFKLPEAPLKNDRLDAKSDKDYNPLASYGVDKKSILKAVKRFQKKYSEGKR